ncbi:MAG: DEAD/DEAH box helicase [Oscillospiraceae bacterium]|nr:DEAD/DEAH box helicase [Oscillospiraceae bacterium]
MPMHLFDPATADWFTRQIGKPTAVQRESWPAIASGDHVLVSAPTGTGKTLSAFLVFVDRLKARANAGEIIQGTQVLYLSPLKALGNDIRENLRRPLDGIPGAEITCAIRSGDTTAKERRQMIQRPPHILITTPESLYLLLTSRSGRRMLQTVRAVIVDELHALINGKRGAHLSLSLARLDRLAGRPVQRIGLSATIEPLDEAARFLAAPDPVTIVAPKMPKAVDIRVEGTLKDMRVLPEGSIWPEIARETYALCQTARTVIAFTEGRAQAEKLAHAVNQIAGEGFARTHHGCVSKEQRLEAEQQLRSGSLRLLCATSSMELGIDVGEVDLVLQLGAPRTIASTMQRLGRAGHNPGRASAMRLFPRTAAECVTCGQTAAIALKGGIERCHPPQKCLDVLAQHLVSMAVDDAYTTQEALALTRRAYGFRTITIEEIESLLAMLSGDYAHRSDRPERPRLLYDRIHGTVSGDAYSRMLALSSGGTIPDRGWFAVRLADGTKLGELDEEYVFEARVGDKFLLGAFAWRILEIRRDSVLVAQASGEGARSPFWKGDSQGRDFQTGLAFGALFRHLADAHATGKLYEALLSLHLNENAAANGARFLIDQIQATGCLPDERTILLEHFTDKTGASQLMVHSVYGGRVNAALAMLLQTEARRAGLDVASFDDDDGCLLFTRGGGHPIPEGLLYALNPDTARATLEAALPASPLFNMAFRYNAARALMMGVRGGGRQPLWVQRLRGAQALEEAAAHPDHPLMAETRRECLDDIWDLEGTEAVLRGVQSGTIAVREVHLPAPSPMSLTLRRQVESAMMYDYAPLPDAVRRSVDQALAGGAGIAPAPEQLQKAISRTRQPQNTEQLHALLMAEGDLVAGEVDAPAAWLEELARQGRAQYIEPGLWICAEQSEQYAAALDGAEESARLRLVRRCLRYRGAQSADTLFERYLWPPEIAQSLLDALAAQGIAVREGDAYYHADLYARAQRETIAARRSQIETLPPERYAALMAARTRLNASPAEQLRHGLLPLLDTPLPPALWEGAVLPARAQQYRPALLDEMLSRGEVFWRMTPGERPLLSFHRQEDLDWDAPFLAQDADLPEDARRIADALARRGASFAQALSAVLPGDRAGDALQTLMEQGFARADSLLPVRQWLENERPGQPPLRQMARQRALAAFSGRWELLRPLAPQSAEAILERAFDRAGLLCRETITGMPWGEALETLRIWEYTGRVRRGYFIRGLSGAQFLRETDFARITLALRTPAEDILWLNAADPAQVWGRVLPHQSGAAFACVPGTAVALKAGKPVALLERQGHTLRALESEALPEALVAFARDWAQGRIFPGRRRITLKEYPPEAAPALEAAGFARQMLDYEMWRSL